MPIELSRARFDALVDQALDGTARRVGARLVDNVVVLVEDEPPEDDPDLLGLYDGLALTERAGDHAGAAGPDLLFRGPLLTCATTEAELVDEVRITVVHEVAHHFGIDDERLHELGYD